MTPPPLRLGIIGGGHRSAIGPAHMAAIRMDGAYQLGPCLFSHAQAEDRASHDTYGLAWQPDVNNLGDWLDRYARTLDLVALLTPSTDHAQQILQLIEREVPFLTEKPVACTLGEVAEIKAALAARPNVQARFVHNYSGYPLFREMVLRLADEEIGKVHHVRVHMPSDGFAREHLTGLPQIWRQKDPLIPMIMLDLGTHMRHLVTMAIGPSPSRVRARMHQFVNTLGVIDNAEIWEERADGVCVSYWMSKAHLGVKNGLGVEVYGRNGAFVWHQMDPDHLIKIDRDSNRTIINRGSIRLEARRHDRFKPGHPTGFVEAFANFYSDLAEDLVAASVGRPGNQWICPIEEAFQGIRFLAAAAGAHTSGDWVEI